MALKEKDLQKKAELMHGIYNNSIMNGKKNRAGFSLLELLIVVAIMGLISVALIPQFASLQTGYGRKQFISRINQLVQFGWQQAVITRKIHRILFDIKNRKASLEVEAGKSAKSKPVFEQLKQVYLSTTITWPDTIIIKQLFIEGFDEMKRFGKTETIWFYLIPDGMVQAVTINFVDKEQIVDNKPKPVGLVLNPFTAQFKVYNAFA